jgi:hypothetical protein
VTPKKLGCLENTFIPFLNITSCSIRRQKVFSQKGKKASKLPTSLWAIFVRKLKKKPELVFILLQGKNKHFSCFEMYGVVEC